MLAWLKGRASLLLGVALVAALGFGAIQTDRLKAAKDLLAANDRVTELLGQRIASDAMLIAERDSLIAKQNSAVLALAEASKANRAAYEARVAAAEKTAQAYRVQAQNIMAREAEAQDEAGRAREALALIQEVIENEK